MSGRRVAPIILIKLNNVSQGVLIDCFCVEQGHSTE